MLKKAGVMLVVDNGLILSVSRKDSKTFGLPGGGFESIVDSSTQNTAVRETIEETGYIISQSEFLFSGHDENIQVDCFYALKIDGITMPSDPSYYTYLWDIRWLTPKQLLGPQGAYIDYNTKVIKAFNKKYPNIVLF